MVGCDAVAMRILALLSAALAPLAAMAAEPIVIAHRGASGERPEHTIAAYTLAIEQGADFIEPDLVLTKDGVLVARHENEISETTDVADRPEFAARKTTKMIDGEHFTGWFTEDFTLAELKTLRARERLPQLRSANTGYDGQLAVPTFDEILALARDEGQRRGRVIGIYPETKHPTYFASIGLPHEAPLLAELGRFGHRDDAAPVFIQSFEVGNLAALRRKTRLRLIQLLSDDGGPADRPGVRYAAMATPAGLAEIARYADGIGVAKAMVIPRDGEGRLGTPTNLTADARRAGLAVHVWTFRRENYFLPADHRRGPDPRAAGNLAGEIRAFLATGIDGLFSDNVAEAVAAVTHAHNKWGQSLFLFVQKDEKKK
jgi:glycerophosphoryl diester phosphodiesterase